MHRFYFSDLLADENDIPGIAASSRTFVDSLIVLLKNEFVVNCDIESAAVLKLLEFLLYCVITAHKNIIDTRYLIALNNLSQSVGDAWVTKLQFNLIQAEATMFQNDLNQAITGGKQALLLQDTWTKKNSELLSNTSLARETVAVGPLVDVQQPLGTMSFDPLSCPLIESPVIPKQLKNDWESMTQKISQSSREKTQYMDRVDFLQASLKRNWDHNDRVAALKVAMSAASLLNEVSDLKNYPLLWIYVTDVLTTFGHLVFQRLASLESGKEETCRNWFFKIACMKDLVTRLYLETALIRCYSFLPDPLDVRRLALTARGIGEPIVAIHYRAFLAHNSLHSNQTYLEDTLLDYLFTMQDFRSRHRHTTHDISLEAYEELHLPAVEYVATVVGVKSSVAEFNKLLERCNSNLHMVDILIRSFPPVTYSHQALQLVRQINNSSENDCLKVKVFATLAEGLTVSPPPRSVRLELLNLVWKVVMNVDDLTSYVDCTAAFVGLTLVHYSEKEVSVLLKNLLRRIENTDVDVVANQLERICNDVCSKKDFAAIVDNEHLIKLLGMFQSEKKASLSKSLLSTFTRTQGFTDNPIVIHTVISIARDLHDSIDALTYEDEKRQVAQIICKFIDKVDFGRNIEDHFNILVECRACFPNLDAVIDRLVVAVAGLAMKTLKIIKQHTKRTILFVKSCIAYCHITIPSIDSPMKRLRMYHLASQAALGNALLPQSESLYQMVISTIDEIPESEAYTNKKVPVLADFLVSFVGSLLLVPGYPKPFQLVQNLLMAIEKYPFWKPLAGSKLQIRIAVVQLLAALRRPTFLDGIKGVDSNDVLYGCSQEYLKDLKTLADSVIQSAVEEILSNTRFTKQALQLADILMVIFDPSYSGTIDRLIKLSSQNRNKQLETYYQSLIKRM